MHTETAIFIRAPKERIFETAADLSRWPQILPHYRYIHYYEKSPSVNVVKMAAVRTGIPIAWVSREEIDREKWEVRFHHLRAFTKGMEVVWRFDEKPDGVHVRILHDLRFRIPLLAPLADRIIGDFFIDYIARKTLLRMKEHFEIADCGLRIAERSEGT